MKILAKLLVGFLSVALLCGVVGFVGITQMGRLNDSLHEMSDVTIPSLGHLNAMSKEFLKIKVAVRNLANPYIHETPGAIDQQIANIETARAAYRVAFDAFELLPKTQEEARLWKVATDKLTAGAAYNNTAMADAKAITLERDPERRLALGRELHAHIFGDGRYSMDDFIAAVDAVVDYAELYYGQERTALALAQAQTGIAILVGVSVVAFGVAVALGLLLGTTISRSLRKAVAILDKVAAGDMSERLQVKSKDEFVQVAASLNQVADTVNELIAEAGGLTAAALAGNLGKRGEATRFKGGYHDIVAGINKTLDAVIGPLNMAAAYVDRISKGDIPPRITEAYNGDFNRLKDNLNVCIDAVKALVDDANMLAQAAVAGQLSTRAEAGRHQGDFRAIIEGVNRTLDLVVNPINETIAILKRMAEGDLTATMDGDYKGDFDVLKTALNDTLGSINELLGQVTVAVEQVTAGSQQVSQASQALSQGATEQASSLEEITSSITEISGQTRQNTENAVQMNGLAKSARDGADQGNAQMKDLVSAMSDINASAEEIRKIVKAIDDISFQINLLALNANVEAARAGKYGKGFAVVAEEVRNLAVRSAGSVQETNRMVNEAIANIGRGNGLVEVTARQLSEIVEGSAKVAVLAEEVATAGKEQAQGLEQISTGLNQIDQVTQSNTASAEESASAAEELSSQSQQLKGMLARFKLRARESRLSQEDVMRLLQGELGRQGLGGRSGLALRLEGQAPGHAVPGHGSGGRSYAAPAVASASPGVGAARTHLGKAGRALDPAEVIALDDDDFGKF